MRETAGQADPAASSHDVVRYATAAFAAARDITARKRADAIALENARQFEAQRVIATTLQESFMHPLPDIEGLQLAALSLPAGREELIGGDFHDVFRRSDGVVVALIGDVMGKGMRAAGFTETVRSAVRTAAFMMPSPDAVLKHVNHILLQEEGGGEIVTALLVTLGPATGRGSYASAGRPPPMRVHDGGAETLESAGAPPLGAFVTDYDATPFELRPGEALVLYTDGVTEARVTDELFGEERLVEVLSRATDPEPQALIDLVRDAVLAFAPQLKDDVEVLAVRRGA